MLRSHLTRGQHGVSQLGLDEGDVAIYPEPYLAPVWVLGSRGDSDSDSEDPETADQQAEASQDDLADVEATEDVKTEKV